jgi:hypothetical protein
MPRRSVGALSRTLIRGSKLDDVQKRWRRLVVTAS